MKTLLLFLLITLSIFANIGNIMALKGEATIHRPTAQTLTATNGMKIFQGDEIVTSSNTRAQVILKDETIITIGENSSFQFDTFLFDGSKNSKIKMKANRGFFRSVTGKISELAPERFTVQTPSATIGIRGTDFSGEIQKTIERFKCYSGEIRITIGSIVRDLGAGDSFESSTDRLKALHDSISRRAKERFVPKTNEISDIAEQVQSEHITKPEIPKPEIPDGTPCEPCTSPH